MGDGIPDRNSVKFKDPEEGTRSDRVEGGKVGEGGRLHHAGFLGHGRNVRFYSKYDWNPLEGRRRLSSSIIQSD